MTPKQKKHFVEVKRDLTQLEQANQRIQLYAPCGCGSGKKFKFCCYLDNRRRQNAMMSWQWQEIQVLLLYTSLLHAGKPPALLNE